MREIDERRRDSMDEREAIAPASAEALAAFRKERETIIQAVAARSLARQEEVAHHGDEAERLITSGIEFTTRMVDAAMAMGEVVLLADQLRWAMDRLPHDGVSPEYVLNRFRIYRQVVEERLPADHAADVVRFLDWMIVRQQELLQREND